LVYWDKFIEEENIINGVAKTAMNRMIVLDIREKAIQNNQIPLSNNQFIKPEVYASIKEILGKTKK
jgi:hypothetical protein